MYPREEPSPAKPFLSAIQQKKVSQEKKTKPVEFSIEP